MLVAAPTVGPGGMLICDFGTLCEHRAGGMPISVTVNLSLTVESAKQLAYEIHQSGQGEQVLVASYLETGTSDATRDEVRYGFLGVGEIMLAEIDGAVVVEFPETMIAYRLTPSSSVAVASRSTTPIP